MKHWKKPYKPLICRVCKFKENYIGDKTSFVKNKGARKDGYTSICKFCYKNYRKIHGKQNKETVKRNRKKIYIKNKGFFIKKSYEWREKNKEKFKIRMSEYSKKAIRYRKKTIKLNFNPRLGVCKVCEKDINKGEIKRTNLHHTKYEYKTSEVMDCPEKALKNTVEVCVSCHSGMNFISNLEYIYRNYPNKFIKMMEIHKKNNNFYLQVTE